MTDSERLRQEAHEALSLIARLGDVCDGGCEENLEGCATRRAHAAIDAALEAKEKEVAHLREQLILWRSDAEDACGLRTDRDRLLSRLPCKHRVANQTEKGCEVCEEILEEIAEILSDVGAIAMVFDSWPTTYANAGDVLREKRDKILMRRIEERKRPCP